MILESATVLVSISRLEHQDVGVKPKTVTLAIMLDTLKVSDSILFVLKGSLPLFATDNHMIERPVKLNSGFARHGSNRPRRKTLSQYSGLTLSPDLIPYPAIRLLWMISTVISVLMTGFERNMD